MASYQESKPVETRSDVQITWTGSAAGPSGRLRRDTPESGAKFDFKNLPDNRDPITVTRPNSPRVASTPLNQHFHLCAGEKRIEYYGRVGQWMRSGVFFTPLT